MDQFTFAQQLIDDFDIDQLDFDMTTLVKQESEARDFATCSMAAQRSTQPVGSVDNCGSVLSRPHSPQPQPALTESVAVKEEFTSLTCHKWTERSAAKPMNFLEMCAAEMLCPEAGVFGRPFADKVLTECVKSVAKSEGVHMMPMAQDEASSPDMLTPSPTPEVLSPVCSSSSSSRSSFGEKAEESEVHYMSENSSDTVICEGSSSKRCEGGQCMLETPPDTPPDTPVPPPAVSRPSKRSRTRGMCPSSVPIEISEDELISLPVRELNKRLQGYPKDQVAHLKQKRRTLKNRGYAQNCRSKRMVQKHELESTNKGLCDEIHKLKKQLMETSRERDFYKQRCEALQVGVSKAMKGSTASQLTKLPSFTLMTDTASASSL
ncbi:uncharacterized protein LOC143285668 [Babylonia areolata]|uniref:uncharacterized protein LOC143285668 n=1 Tax=Babylonia areolata TaxID=304850 RepID=UPI003FCFA8BF